MKKLSLYRRRAALLLAALAGVLVSARAQQLPDAGRVLNERRPVEAAPRRSDAPPTRDETIRPAMRAAEGARFRVEAIRFSGQTVVDEAELQALAAPLLGGERSLAELEALADRVTALYRERGFFVARAYVPAQDVRGGQVEIVVREGQLGQIEVRGAQRLAAGTVEAHVAAALPGESPVLREDRLERALLLLNDLPGVQAQATLLPGTRQATTQLRVDVQEGPRLRTTLGLDNHGNRYTGSNRPAITFEADDPAGFGDQARISYSGLADNPYLGAGYSWPVGAGGLRASVDAARTLYRLCCELAASGAHGSANVIGARLDWPIVRSRRSNWNAELGLERRRFVDIVDIRLARQASVLTATLSHEGRDDGFGGGVNAFAASLVFGRLSLDDAVRAADAEGARTQGSYRKLLLRLSRLQALPGDVGLFAGLTLQLASKNLDSSEEFALGGPGGVRAYPVGEASGDQALLLNLELRRELVAQLQGYLFLDRGEVQLNRHAWSDEGLPNRYGLGGAGVGLAWAGPQDLLVRAALARRVGGNPGRDPAGKDSDGRRPATRLWVQAQRRF